MSLEFDGFVNEKSMLELGQCFVFCFAKAMELLLMEWVEKKLRGGWMDGTMTLILSFY